MKEFDQHHMFSKHKNRKKKYGELIHDDSNLQIISHNDHMSGKGKHKTEREFLKDMKIMECKYCKYYIPGYLKPCVKFYGVYAMDCREFNFDMKKYKEVNK